MTDTIFIGRKNELRELSLLLTKNSASLIVVRGRRRIGKSRLIEEFAKNKRFIHFSGIAPTAETTAQSQRDIFTKQLGRQLHLPGLQAADWVDLFTLLANQTQQGEVIVLFDEISWMGTEDPDFLGKLKNAWDMEFKKNPKFILVLCGSVSTWIQKNIIASTAFFGRISLYLTLEELPLPDCNQLLEAQGFKGSLYEKFKLLSVTGGIPWYLEQIHSKLDANENIKHLCFKKDSLLLNEFDLIFHDFFTKRSENYKKIIEILAKGSAEFSQIYQELRYPNSGVLSEYLEDLLLAGFITRDYTWLLKTGKESRLSHFRLSDNYLRFYLKYVAPNRKKILTGSFHDPSMSSFPYWNTVMGLQFENLVLKNRKTIREILRIKSEDIIADNPFFQRKTSKQPGCQIDYLIQTRFNTLFACEIKFSHQEIKSDIIDEVKQKLDRLLLPRGFSCFPVLVHVNGLHDAVSESKYFAEIIDFGTLLDTSPRDKNE